MAGKLLSLLIFYFVYFCHGCSALEDIPIITLTTQPTPPEDPAVEADTKATSERTLSLGASGLFEIRLVEPGRTKRAVSNSTKVWPTKIPYVIDNSFAIKGSYYIVLLKRAMQYIMNKVCLTLVDVTSTYPGNDLSWFLNNGFQTQSYLKIIDAGGCSAEIGPGSYGARQNSPCTDFVSFVRRHSTPYFRGPLRLGEDGRGPNNKHFSVIYWQTAELFNKMVQPIKSL